MEHFVKIATYISKINLIIPFTYYFPFKNVQATKRLLQFLEWNDLLRLRRVCKETKTIAEDFIRSNPDGAPQIEIDENNEKTFDAFVAMNISTTKLFINNPSGYTFYEQNGEEMSKFLKIHAKTIKHLRVTEMSIDICHQERDFIEALENLNTLEVDCFGYGQKIECAKALQSVSKACTLRAMKDPRYIQNPMPKNLVNLKTKFIGRRKNIEFYSIPQTFTQLRYSNLTCVTSNGMSQEKLLQDRFETLNTALNFVKLSITLEPLNVVETDALNFYDFEGLGGKTIPGLMAKHTMETDWLLSPLFLEICYESVQKGIQLLNVHCLFYCQRFCSAPEYASPELGLPVVSLVGMHAYMMTLNMRNLEKITIPSTFTCTVGRGVSTSNRPEWPALKHLDITVDDKDGMCMDFIGKTRFEDIELGYFQPTSVLFAFFFRDIVRSNMTDISLQFDGDNLPLPKLEDIAVSCPNLKRVKLRNWLGTNKALANLWSGLKKLEDISLEYCKNLGNVAFVGSDVGNPVFLGLKSKSTSESMALSL